MTAGAPASHRGGLANYVATASEIAGAHPVGVVPVLVRMLTAKALYGLSANEYAMFGLHRQPLRSLRHYRTKKQTTAMLARINQTAQSVQVDDKLAFWMTCQRSGLPQPALLAVLRMGSEPLPGLTVPVLPDFAALLSHFAGQPERRLIIKPRSDALGTGVRYTALSRDGPVDIDGKPIDAASFGAALAADMRRDDYLVQSFVEPHPAVARLGSGKALGTVRAVTYLADHGAQLLYTLLRIPSAGNVHDNFSGGASGNLIAHVDTRTGRVGPGFGRRRHSDMRQLQAFDRNPETGEAISGSTLPMWNELCDLALRAARLFPVLPLLGWDFALSRDGVIVIEANANPDIIGAQVTSGQGAAELLRAALAA